LIEQQQHLQQHYDDTIFTINGMNDFSELIKKLQHESAVSEAM